MIDDFQFFNSRKHELKNLTLEFIKTVRKHMVCVYKWLRAESHMVNSGTPPILVNLLGDETPNLRL